MKLVEKNITLNELKKMSSRMFGGMVKAVIDVKKQTMIVDAALHADEESYLLVHGSKQDDLWGINLYPDLFEKEFIEFDSMINVRPRLNNFTRSIEDEKLRKKIIQLVKILVKP